MSETLMNGVACRVGSRRGGGGGSWTKGWKEWVTWLWGTSLDAAVIAIYPVSALLCSGIYTVLQLFST